jgi:hypothetical protein
VGLPVTLLAWKPLRRNSLRGFAKVRVGRTLILHDVAVHQAGERRWAQPAAKPQIDKDGAIKRDATGKPLYVPIVEWTDREAADAFSVGVVDAIEREYPGATAA